MLGRMGVVSLKRPLALEKRVFRLNNDRFRQFPKLRRSWSSGWSERSTLVGLLNASLELL